MAYQLRYMMYVDFLADGAQALGDVPAQQTICLGQVALQGIGLAAAPGQPTGHQPVGGGNSPVASNFATALTGSVAVPSGGMALDLYTAILANLGQIQGFATGGG